MRTCSSYCSALGQRRHWIASSELGRLEESRRSIEKDIGSRDLRRTDAVARADGLRRVPHESDHLFSELINALARVGWTQPPNNKGENEKLGEALQTALTNARDKDRRRLSIGG